VHRNIFADNPFVAKNQNLYFVVDDSGLIFENYLVTINIWTTKIQMAKMPLESLLTDIFTQQGLAGDKYL